MNYEEIIKEAKTIGKWMAAGAGVGMVFCVALTVIVLFGRLMYVAFGDAGIIMTILMSVGALGGFIAWTIEKEG